MEAKVEPTGTEDAIGVEEPVNKEAERARIELEEEQATAAKVALEKRIKALGRASLSTNIPARFIIGALRVQADSWRDSLHDVIRENERERNRAKARSQSEEKHMVARERAHANAAKSFDDAVEAVIRAFTQHIILLEESGLDERGIDTWSDEVVSLDCDDDDPKSTITTRISDVLGDAHRLVTAQDEV